MTERNFGRFVDETPEQRKIRISSITEQVRSGQYIVYPENLVQAMLDSRKRPRRRIVMPVRK